MPILAVVVGPLLGAGPAVGQSLADSVAARNQEYDAQLSAWRAAVQARGVAETQFGNALNQVDLATDDSGREAAQRVAWNRALEMQRLDARVSEVEARLDTARDRLIAALDAQLDRLQNQLVNATTPAARQRLDALVEDLQNQYAELQEEGASGIPAPPAYYPAMSWDPRDGVAGLQLRIGLLERKASEAEERIAEAQDELDRLTRRLRLQRTRSDSDANLDRFGDTQPPVGSAGNPVDLRNAIVADTTGVTLTRLPLPQQIELWQAFIAQLEQLRDDVRAQAAVFRAMISRGDRPRLAPVSEGGS